MGRQADIRRGSPARHPRGLPILYIGATLPKLSETFVYRELLGLRNRGRPIRLASVHRPGADKDDPALAALAREALVVYSAATAAVLPLALAFHARVVLRGVADAFTADHRGPAARIKHVGQVAMAAGAAWRLRGAGIGHVHAHMANTPATVGLYIARALGATFSFTGHAADLFVHRQALAFKLREAAFVSCISAWHRDFYREQAAIDPARLPVVRCSVEMPGEISGGSGGDIVTVARLVAKKGIDILLRAYARLAAADPSAPRLRVIGDGPERAGLEALAEELGIAARVDFAGARPHAACLDAIRGAAVFALPCRTATSGDKDGIPVVLMEAMAAARAVVAGDLPTMRELVEDGASGMLVPPDDVAALGDALAAVVADPGLRRRLGAAARARVAEEFADDVNWDRLERAFDAVASLGPAGAQ